MKDYDGLFLSNGPGDPKMCVETTAQLAQVLSLEGDAVKPIFGICLGNQLMGLAPPHLVASLLVYCHLLEPPSVPKLRIPVILDPVLLENDWARAHVLPVLDIRAATSDERRNELGE